MALPVEPDRSIRSTAACWSPPRTRAFAWHPGVDPLAVLRASAQLAVSGHVVSGASTLTMQVARLLERHPRSLSAKLGEMAKALALERRLSKTKCSALF